MQKKIINKNTIKKNTDIHSNKSKVSQLMTGKMDREKIETENKKCIVYIIGVNT